jgi:hypothetical protein
MDQLTSVIMCPVKEVESQQALQLDATQIPCSDVFQQGVREMCRYRSRHFSGPLNFIAVTANKMALLSKCLPCLIRVPTL